MSLRINNEASGFTDETTLVLTDLRHVGTGLASDTRRPGFTRVFVAASRLDRVGIAILRIGLVIVLLWIGSLKFAKYEADSIVPFVANSPLMSFFYHHRAPEYRHFVNKEGELNAAHREWHQGNGTYAFSDGLGTVIVGLALLIALHPVLPQVSAVGSFLVMLMACTTLSFLITTPEAWVPALGDSTSGFPYLAGPGRLVIKDAIMFGAAMVTMTDSARVYLMRRKRKMI
jgi:uncharacterized membrane protein YkgB